MIIAAVAVLTFIVHLLGSFAYSTRITGIISRRLTVSLSVANFFSLLSRLCSFLIIPLLSGKIEKEIQQGHTYTQVPLHYLWLLLAAVAGCMAGILFFSRSIRFFLRCVEHYTPNTNLVMVVSKAVFAKSAETVPITAEKYQLNKTDWRYLALNVLVICVFTSSTLAALYCAYLVPAFRVTALSTAFLLNGIASFFFAAVIDPYLSILTDATYNGHMKAANFYYFVRVFLWSRMAGVLLSLATFQVFIYSIVHVLKYLV